jgi:predicted ArsR family transcriptional regulator
MLLSDSDNTKLLRDIKKILAVLCIANLGNLKKELLATELDQQVYDLCTRKSVEEIAGGVTGIGPDGVYNRVTEWEKRGLLMSEQVPEGRGRPKKYFIKMEEFLR